MPNYNRVMLMGHLTRDPEIRTLPSGSVVASIGVATSRKFRNSQTNEMTEETTFVDCEAFGRTAENIGRFFAKGQPIFIEGRLRLDQWEDKRDGSKRSKLKVIVENFTFVESGGGQGGGNAGGGNRQQRQEPRGGGYQPTNYDGGGHAVTHDDEIPF